MTWTTEKSLERIRRFKANVPETAITVEDFAGEYLPRRVELAKARLLTEASSAAIVDIPRDRAILTDGVHVYADLMDFNDQLTSDPVAEKAFRRSLQFLHLHYGACDRLIQLFGLQRVDFHGSRLHAVVLTPTGEDNEVERVARALAFARAFMAMVTQTGARFEGRFSTRVSIGIDSGRAIAINSGRGAEHEPLFIGRPANHAAHLAACGIEGIHLSERIRGRLATLQSLWPTSRFTVDQLAQRGLAGRTRDGLRTLGEAVNAELTAFDVELASVEQRGALAVFNFHHHLPPLKTIDFGALPPSNTILMNMAAVFADLDGFTAYVDRNLADGNARQVVANLHVLRGEMAATVRDDFKGRKVRFIGDCLKAVVAEGDARQTDPEATVDTAVLTAGALRSSFDLCRQELTGIQDLGLAIGVEYGLTPACRIGLRGDDGVRCVTSGATCESERLQRECDGVETSVGEAAIEAGGLNVQRAFRHSNVIPNLTYPAAIALLRGLPRAKVGGSVAPVVKAHGR